MANQKEIDPLFRKEATTREELMALGREINARAGIVGEPTMTAEELQASQRASGVRAEDNIGSRELMRMRYGDDWEEEK